MNLHESTSYPISPELRYRWYLAKDNPEALLRAGARTKNPWLKNVIQEKFFHLPNESVSVLDLACGAGFLSNDLSKEGYTVTGLDSDLGNLLLAREYDVTEAVKYVQGDLYRLPFEDESFDVVTCMDFLERSADPVAAIREASRVLKPRGIFAFHSLNRNWVAGLVMIKGMEYFVKNTPKNSHDFGLFLKPEEVEVCCKMNGLEPEKIVGLTPDVKTAAFWKMIAQRHVPDDFSFQVNDSTKLAYLGYAVKVH